jgi:WS/DGAT/MGAT family acyltransferase
MKRLSGMDASFLYMETPSMHAHVVGTLVLDPAGGEFGWERFVDVIAQRLPKLPPFRRRLATVPFNLSHPLWVEDPDFDLDSHLHHIAVPAPGTMHELARIVGEIAGTPLDRHRPLWEAWIVDGLANGHVAFVSKIHHAAIDGVSGADLMAQLLDLEPNPPEDVTDDTWVPDDVPTDGELVVGAMRHVVSNPVRMAKVLNRTARNLVGVLQRQREAAQADPDVQGPAMPFTAPRVPWSRSITPHRVVAFGRAALDDMRHVKTVFGTTVNDVVLAACTQTLRAYLIDQGELPDKPLVCSVPVSVHGKSEHEGTNQVSTMFVRLPVQLGDPVEQLLAIREDTRKAKDLHNALGADVLQDFAQFIPPALFNRAMRLYSNLNLADRHRPIHNLVISNVPGPPIPLYIAGARVVSMYPFGPLLEGAGLNITVLSNMGNVDFGVIGCRETVPGIEQLADGFGTAVDALRRAADVRAGSAGTVAKAATRKRSNAKPDPVPDAELEPAVQDG